jgi:hypothetical protein
MPKVAADSDVMRRTAFGSESQEGFENLPDTLNRFFTGKDLGKQLLRIAEARSCADSTRIAVGIRDQGPVWPLMGVLTSCAYIAAGRRRAPAQRPSGQAPRWSQEVLCFRLLPLLHHHLIDVAGESERRTFEIQLNRLSSVHALILFRPLRSLSPAKLATMVAKVTVSQNSI